MDPDNFAFFNPGKFKLTPQQVSGGLNSEPASGPSITTRNAEAQATASAESTPLTTGGGNPLGLPPMNWVGVSSAIGAAQNMISSTSANAGNGLATGIANASGSTAGSLASSAVSSIFSSSPLVGTFAGSLAGALASNFTSKLVGTEATKLLSGINLQPIQKILGQALGLAHKTEDTFGFLLPSPPDYQDISLSGRLAQPLAKDASITYKNGAPFIPTLSHQKVVWQTPRDGELPYTAVKKSQAVASRMSFMLEGRQSLMSLLVNPKQLQMSRSNVMSSSVSRSGFIVNPTGPGEFDLNISGTTAGFYEEEGLSPRETRTVAYSNLLLLYNFFANNGYIFDDEQNLQRDDAVPSEAAPMRRINSMSYVTIEWQKWKWWGFFKSFKISDTSDNPYTLNYDFTFRVCHESDNFKIDNARGDGRQSPAVTGHVTEGYSSERTLAQRVLSNENPPNVIQGSNPKHKNAIMSDFMFTDDSPTSSLNPTVSIKDSAKRLSLGGYSLTSVSGPDGERFFGQAPDGTAVDLNGLANQRGLTVVAPGSSPVHYASVSENQTDPNGAPIVVGTVIVSPGDLPYKFSMPGKMARNVQE